MIQGKESTVFFATGEASHSFDWRWFDGAMNDGHRTNVAYRSMTVRSTVRQSVKQCRLDQQKTAGLTSPAKK